MGALVAGVIMDFGGTRAARLFSSVFVVAGALMLAYAGPESPLWFPGLACLGFGGNGVQITSFHISNLFAGNERLVVRRRRVPGGGGGGGLPERGGAGVASTCAGRGGEGKRMAPAVAPVVSTSLVDVLPSM